MAAAGASPDATFGMGLARAYAGAVIFGLPLFMTMEMWSLGFAISPARLALLLVLFLPFLVALSWHAGFEPTFDWIDDVLDALVAFAVGVTTSLALLSVMGVLQPGMSAHELVGMVALQAVPASIGALLSQSMLGDDSAGDVRGGASSYASELFIMAVGALFLAFNMAPTEEMQRIALRMGEGQALLLVLLSLAVMHGFVYSVAFRGRHEEPQSALSVFLRFTVVGYAIALLLCAYLLWTFGRLEGASLASALKVIAVLGLPAAVGAAAARLIL